MSINYLTNPEYTPLDIFVNDVKANEVKADTVDCNHLKVAGSSDITSVVAVAPPLVNNGTISIQKASGVQDGFLSKEDYTLFASATADTITANHPLVVEEGKFGILESSESSDGYVKKEKVIEWNNKQDKITDTLEFTDESKISSSGKNMTLDVDKLNISGDVDITSSNLKVGDTLEINPSLVKSNQSLHIKMAGPVYDSDEAHNHQLVIGERETGKATLLLSTDNEEKSGTIQSVTYGQAYGGLHLNPRGGEVMVNKKLVVNDAQTPLENDGGIIKINKASGLQDGYLDKNDFMLFSNKQDLLAFNSPLQKTGDSISIGHASSASNGVLSSVDWTRFNNKMDSFTASAPLMLNSGFLSLPQANDSSSGYLSSSDYTALWSAINSKASSYIFNAPLSLIGSTVSMPAVSGSSNGYVTSGMFNTWNSKQDGISNLFTMDNGFSIETAPGGLATIKSNNSPSLILDESKSITGKANQGTINVDGDLKFSNGYSALAMSAGNSDGYLFNSWGNYEEGKINLEFGDGPLLSFNYVKTPGLDPVIQNHAGGASLLQITYGGLRLLTTDSGVAVDTSYKDESDFINRLNVSSTFESRAIKLGGDDNKDDVQIKSKNTVINASEEINLNGVVKINGVPYVPYTPEDELPVHILNHAENPYDNYSKVMCLLNKTPGKRVIATLHFTIEPHPQTLTTPGNEKPTTSYNVKQDNPFVGTAYHSTDFGGFPFAGWPDGVDFEPNREELWMIEYMYIGDYEGGAHAFQNKTVSFNSQYCTVYTTGDNALNGALNIRIPWLSILGDWDDLTFGTRIIRLSLKHHSRIQ